MNHFVLVRSAYSPELWPEIENKTRLLITEGVTVQSLSSQTCANWGLVVLVDAEDQFLERRKDIFRAVNEGAVFIEQRSVVGGRASTAYRSYKDTDWLGAVGMQHQPCITTRLDDDDALGPKTLAEVQEAVKGIEESTAIIHPRGIRVWEGKYDTCYNDKNAMHSFFATEDDTRCVYSYDKIDVRGKLPIADLKKSLGWLYLRHSLTLTANKRAGRPLEEGMMKQFDVDWQLVGAL